MAQTLGSLVVKLGLDASEFTSGLTKGEREAQRLGGLGSLFGSVAGPGDAGWGMDLGGGRATGGVALPGSTHRVNEYGPELLDVNGKSFLMMGNQRGKVTPLGKGGGDIYNVNVTAGAGVSHEQAMNQGRAIQRGMQIQAGRRSRNS